MTVVADQYDFAVSLLMLPNDYVPRWQDDPGPEDSFDRLVNCRQMSVR